VRYSNRKEELFMVAKTGEKKPHYKTKLGSALKNYLTKSSSSYDPAFDAKIRKLRPDWFK